jgi:hypothetical protein
VNHPDFQIAPNPPKGASVVVTGETSIGVDFDLRHVQVFDLTDPKNPRNDITNKYRQDGAAFLPENLDCELAFYFMDSSGDHKSSAERPSSCAAVIDLLRRAAVDARDHPSATSVSSSQ